MIELCQCYFVARKGALPVYTIIVRLVDLSINKVREILNGPLPALDRNYKNKRPPPITA